MTASLIIGFKHKIAYLMYSLLWLLLTPLLLLNLLFCLLIRKQGYTLARLSRFGLCKTNKSNHNILIHCASVGEVVTIQNLVEKLLTYQPQISIIITTNTTTGADRVKTLFADKISHYYLPYDFPLFVWLFFKIIEPQKILINEMELWPNLCRSSKKMNIPLYLVNGRMSEKSTKTYLKFPALFQPMFDSFEHICAQSQRDYKNYLSLGVEKQRITLTNNIKFELNIDPTELSTSQNIIQTYGLKERRILLAGSTHDPEEKILLEAYLALSKTYKNLLLVIVPRHPQRFEKVQQLLIKQSIKISLMSQQQSCDSNTQVLLCDQMGKLRALYNLAEIAFVGGSIAERGGHNALEPAIFDVPILMGPSVYNNPAIQQTLKDAGALKTVHNAEDIKTACQHWLDNTELRNQDGQAGGLVIQQNKGAINKTLLAIGLANTNQQ
ncbi:3-deoxy-D-manno-octulosonic acid transferase [Paraglaciecola sp. L3A3]|uniref:3-deoxy-D-manno-octulosonic acid transferase n=1 Tax=Paraglaciecola sp. L3A3 TaxID=2686358 RepID=UPI00131D63C6|nr:3-deoxy-D-manno-octulosonic acid transferase [Paraglaciecola sp. L3A3]